MANNENPLGIFPFSKEHLETLLANGTLVDATRKYYRNAARLLHPDQGGKDFVDYGLAADGVFKVLNGAFQQIESADAAQLGRWVKSYGNGGGISEEQVARILVGAQVLRDQLIAAQGENVELERRLQDMVRAIGRGQNIPESRLREMLAGRGGADPAIVRQLEARVANAERERDRYRTDVNATVRDCDAAQRQARDLNTELDAMRRDKIAKQREADAYKGQRDAARTNAVKYERIANAHQKQADGLEQTLKDVREENQAATSAAEQMVRNLVLRVQSLTSAHEELRRRNEHLAEVVASKKMREVYADNEVGTILLAMEEKRRQEPSGDNHYALARAYISLGRIGKGQDELQAAWKKDRHLSSGLLLVDLSLHQNKTVLAQTFAEQIARTTPLAQYQLGVIYQRYGEVAQAEMFFKGSVAAGSANAAFALAELYASQRKVTLSRNWAQRTLEIDPTYAAAKNLLK